MDTSYILNHLGEERENYYGAVTPPAFQSVNFAYKNVATLREALKKEFANPFYSRGFNPGVAILRKKLAALEGSEDALVFSSGNAAATAGILSVVKSGDHIVSVKKPYSWTGSLMSNYLAKYNVSVSYVDGTVAANFEKAINPNTRLIYLESPNSLTFELQDIEAIVKIARKHSVTTLIDNTYCSPINQQPIKMGVDIVIHSGTKYLNGHSDLLAGVVCSTKKRIDGLLAEEYMTLGGTMSAHDAWLMTRGLRTLELRVNRSGDTAQQVAEFLNQHPKIEKVNYPFLTSNPQYELAKKQMKKGGGLLSVFLKTKNTSAVEKFCDSLKRFLIATSWGGYESLVYPMCALNLDNESRKTLPDNLIRIYIGLEDAGGLIGDLEQALEKMG